MLPLQKALIVWTADGGLAGATGPLWVLSHGRRRGGGGAQGCVLVRAPPAAGDPAIPALDGGRGGVARFTLPPRAVSRAVAHRTFEEVRCFVSGRGRMWRRLGCDEEIVGIGPGTSLATPIGTRFQFRSDSDEPLSVIGATMSPWPGEGEPTPSAGRGGRRSGASRRTGSPGRWGRPVPIWRRYSAAARAGSGTKCLTRGSTSVCSRPSEVRQASGFSA